MMNMRGSVWARIGLVIGGAQVLPHLGCSASPPLDAENMGGAGGGSSGGGGQPPMQQMTGTPLPCNVNAVVVNNCQACHGARLIGGAPMHLVTQEDFTRVYTAQTTEAVRGQMFPVFELARMRLNSSATPMPPGATISAADRTLLDAWLGAGAPAGTEADRICTPMGTGGTGSGGVGSGGVGAGGVVVGGTAGVGPGGAGGVGGYGSECDATAAYEPLVPLPGETCYEFAIHGAQGVGDTSKYSVVNGEHYQEFYFRVPWPTGSLATRFGSRFENLEVLHHWLLFTSARSVAEDGTHRTVLGTQIGDTAQLLAGWAVGGCNFEFPPDLAVELPANGTMLNVQWHFYNNTPAPIPDGSAVQVCTVPAGSRPNVGSMTWLGTENFFGPLGMPQGQHEFGGTCVNDSGAPITIWGFWPHMHKLGRNMRSVVRRSNGTDEVVFDRPFDFNRQIHYVNNPYVVLQPGESITSTCTFMNDTGANVAFGAPTSSEMCYQFALSYPARALDNGVLSLIGATNTCW